MFSGYIIPHDPSLLQAGSHMSVEGRMTCWVPGELKAEGFLNRFNWARPDTAMQTSPDRNRATGKSRAPRRPQALCPCTQLGAAVWLIWYTHSLRTHYLHVAMSRGVPNYPIPVVYLKNMLIQQSYDCFVAQGITVALKSGNCLPPCACACLCVCLCASAFVCMP